MNLKIKTKFKIYFYYLFSYNFKNFYRFLVKNHKISKSQVFQDLFVIYYSKFKYKGYFIEIGGGNGVDLSNTYLLEKKYKWKGIICEPDRKNQSLIKKKRETYLEKKPLDINCNKKKVFFENHDAYKSSLNKSQDFVKKYLTKTICLNHLIKKKKIKDIIDYISIDTEGNEFEIIKKFNFKKFRVNMISIEHNFDQKKRYKIYNLLKKKNFERVFKNLSYMDDWYINKKFSNGKN